MNIRNTILIIASISAFQIGAGADTPRDPYGLPQYGKAITDIIDLVKQADENRGGAGTKRPLGFYFQKQNVAFKSPYAKLPPQEMAEFASELHSYNVKEGGGFAAFQEAAKNGSLKSPGSSDAITAQAMQNLEAERAQAEAVAKVHVSYEKQTEFARKWWSAHERASFKTEWMPAWWLNDSVLDANYLWLKYEQQTDSSKDHQYFMEQELERLANKR